MEQIWCGWNTFGVGGANLGVGGVDVGRTVWRVADCVSFYFRGLNF